MTTTITGLTAAEVDDGGAFARARSLRSFASWRWRSSRRCFHS